MADRMLGLTLTQPWATLVAYGAKRIETRDWSTDWRGPVAIAAAKGLSGLDDLVSGPHAHEPDLQRIVNSSPYWDELRSIEGLTDTGVVQADRLPRFAIVAVCNIALCIPVEEQLAKMRAWVDRSDTDTVHALRQHQVDRELALGDYSAGRYAWLLAAVRPLEPPLPITPGAVRYFRKLWAVPPDLAARALGSPQAV